MPAIPAAPRVSSSGSRAERRELATLACATEATALLENRHVDRAGLGPVELAEEDRLVAAERQPPVAKRDQHVRPGDGGAAVRGAVRAVHVVVHPPPVVADDPLERALEVVDERWVDPLVDRDRRRRMRNVDEDGGPGGAPHRLHHPVRDVDQLGLPVAGQAELVHRRRILVSAMSIDTVTDRELDAFRDDADRFIAELDDEYYLHLAGHKETLELEGIYERHERLTRLETAQRLEGAPTELWRFACEGYLGGLTREHAERLARVESELVAEVGGQQVPYRMLRVALSNEPDRDKRAQLERARLDLLDERLNP